MLTKQTVNYSDLTTFSFNNHYDGDRLVYRTESNYGMWFDYDETGSPIAMTLTTGSATNYYYFIKNLQGDVIALADTSGTIVRKYNYDAWGSLLSITDGNDNVLSLSPINYNDPAIANPFRYRSYFYDDYSGKYWLQTRFYDPVTGRFINGDGYLSMGQGVLGSNLFLYCSNNPINFFDPTGEFLVEIGDFFKNRWNEFISSFGAGYTKTEVIEEYEEPLWWDNAPITAVVGSQKVVEIDSRGDSSKPISVYANGVLGNIIGSSAGIKLNRPNFTIDISLGLDNIGITGSYSRDDITDSFGIRANLSEFKVGFEYSNSIQKETYENIKYVNVSVEGWFIIALFAPSSSGQQVRRPLYSY